MWIGLVWILRPFKHLHCNSDVKKSCFERKNIHNTIFASIYIPTQEGSYIHISVMLSQCVIDINIVIGFFTQNLSFDILALIVKNGRFLDDSFLEKDNFHFAHLQNQSISVSSTIV